MHVLNLTEGFNPYGRSESHSIGFEYFTFFGGEPFFRLNYDLSSPADLMITQRIKSFQDVGLLLVAVDAVRREFALNSLKLFLPYFPGARQDRLMVPGESLTVKVYADLINSLKLDQVIIYDPHSDVAPALLNNCTTINNHNLVKHSIAGWYNRNDSISDYPAELKKCAIVSPDAGSHKKIYGLMKEFASSYVYFKNAELVKCDKMREPSTGEIKEFVVHRETSLVGRDVFVVDDICDGGGTFLGLGEMLRKFNPSTLHLIVSHGLFSKGFKELAKYYDKIYTTDSWRSNISMETPEIEKKSEIVEVIKLQDII